MKAVGARHAPGPPPPPQLPQVAGLERLERRNVIGPAPSLHAFVPGLRGRVDRDDDEGLTERLSKYCDLRLPPETVHEDSFLVDPRQGPLCPNSISVGHPFRMAHAAPRGPRNREVAPLRFFPPDVSHA